VNIFISGSSGFVGTNLTQYLNNSIEATIIPITREMFSKDSFPSLDGTIIHLAGKAHDLKSRSNKKEYQLVNVELTKQLFDAFIKSNANTFIFISSVKAVADIVDSNLTEETIPSPKTEYGISKLAAEKYLLSKNLPLNKKLFILRPAMIHGPGNKGNLNLLYNLVSKGVPYPLGAYHNLRSFLSVDNLCFVISELIIQKDIPSGVYNVADSRPFSTVELINVMADVLGKKPRIWTISPLMINFITKLGDILRLPLNSHRLNKLTESYLVSNKKLLSAIKKPLPIQGNEGLIKTFKSFKSAV
jgi:nucleoside-diphosphate-sugar epimerase